ncbi:proclotting enzyme-like [Brachionus plicatilis]|uniref:Proclotting enzyme-like n=1 Tax=Brachionus plicatilis TaxID=10195 RepID=A0A3M7PNW2_BRAPC|nr:proclotting enzyme-like [Brachionus plicatilis]
MDFDNYAYRSNPSRSKATVNIQHPKKNRRIRPKIYDPDDSTISINYLKVQPNEIRDATQFNSSYHEASFDNISHSNIYTITQNISPEKLKPLPVSKSNISYRGCIIAFILSFVSIAAIVLAVSLPISLIERVDPIVKYEDTTTLFDKSNISSDISTTEHFSTSTTISTKRIRNCSNGFVKSSCEECGVSFKIPNVKIVGGIIAEKHSWPSMAFVLFNYTFSAGASVITRKKFCGGTLINRYTILTAAHCFVTQVSYFNFINEIVRDVRVNQFHPTYQSMYTVYLGMHNLSGIFDKNQVHGQQYFIKDFIIHPNFDPETNLNDIGIIKLEKEVTLGENIQLGCLSTSSLKSYPNFSNVDAYAVGWGTTVYDGIESFFLRNIKLTLYEGFMCNDVFKDIEKNWMTQMCAGEILGGKDTCQGDSGGPLFIKEEVNGTSKFVLVGITSYGEQCALPGLPGIYTRVNAFKDWISSIVNK